MDNLNQKSESVPANQPTPGGNPSRLIGSEVAQELDTIFTVIRGFTDRMRVKHGGNAALRTDLQLISENARRAELVVRSAVQAGPRAPSVAA